jgi:ribosomal-protein-alanine N-acetyltransferase
MNPLPLMTERLQLRRACLGDTERLFKTYYSDVERSRFLTRKSHTQPEQTASFLKHWCDEAWESNAPQFSWVIALQTTNEAIGVFLVISKEKEAQIHYGIGRNFEGRGLITEAGALL